MVRTLVYLYVHIFMCYQLRGSVLFFAECIYIYIIGILPFSNHQLSGTVLLFAECIYINIYSDAAFPKRALRARYGSIASGHDMKHVDWAEITSCIVQ
jgi:hypothetical protein